MRPGLHRLLIVAWAIGILGFVGYPRSAAAAAAATAANNPAPVLADPLSRLHHEVELPLVLRFQQSFQAGLLMRYVSKLGPVEFGAAAAGLLFFGFRPRLGVRLGIFLLAALWFRELLALALHSPRPYWLEPRLQSFGEISPRSATFGLPSGHMLGGTAVWLYLAAEVRRRWMWGLAFVVPAAVAVSRVYLGVHFISDVALGGVLGIALTAGYRLGEPAVLRAVTDASRATRLSLALAAAVAALVLPWAAREVFASGAAPESWATFADTARKLEGAARFAGAFLGLGAGLVALGRFPGGHGPLRFRLIRLAAAGVLAVFVLRPAGRAILEVVRTFPHEWIRVTLVTLVYAGIGGLGAWGLPWLMLRLGWDRPELRSAPSTPGHPSRSDSNSPA